MDAMEIKTVILPQGVKAQSDRNARRYGQILRELLKLKPANKADAVPALAVPRSYWTRETPRQIQLAIQRAAKRHKLEIKVNAHGEDTVYIWRQK
ncbi:MAG TPA: hypothetical protein VMW54_06195 [Terriglobia bacterium]|nr:hypothetical protein [Terriglobia bacterium]HUZ46210.1 hypothetical protein [Terriglobia bacterium]